MLTPRHLYALTHPLRGPQPVDDPRLIKPHGTRGAMQSYLIVGQSGEEWDWICGLSIATKYRGPNGKRERLPLSRWSKDQARTGARIIRKVLAPAGVGEISFRHHGERVLLGFKKLSEEEVGRIVEVAKPAEEDA